MTRKRKFRVNPGTSGGDATLRPPKPCPLGEGRHADLFLAGGGDDVDILCLRIRIARDRPAIRAVSGASRDPMLSEVPRLSASRAKRRGNRNRSELGCPSVQATKNHSKIHGKNRATVTRIVGRSGAGKGYRRQAKVSPARIRGDCLNRRNTLRFAERECARRTRVTRQTAARATQHGRAGPGT